MLDRLASLLWRAVLGAAPALVLVQPAAAHDFWIEPSSFRPAAGTTVSVRLWVGERLEGDPVPRSFGRIERFVWRGPSGEAPIDGVEGADPAGLLRVPRRGLLTIAYRGRRSAITLAPAKFDAYLAEEGLDRVLHHRRQRGDAGREGREVFSRCAKALIQVEGSRGGGSDQPLGLTLELVAETNPYRLRAGEDLTVRLLYEGRPLAGARLAAVSRTSPDQTIVERTDPEGRARLHLDRPGMWLIKAVHMVEAPRGLDAEWESLWASLTFEMPPR